MSGIYFHIPFCRKACTYCDFHFSTSLGAQDRVLQAMARELNDRVHELGGDRVGTIYFGGGTPSLIPSDRIAAFIQQAHKLFGVDTDAEVTLEANPDDITQERIDAWKSAGITRISLGTQSFRDERLRWMGRAHDAQQALASIAMIAKGGFATWTIDLIYGLPEMTIEEWDEQLTIALDHGMPHLSAYGLTVEPRTALAHQVKQGLVVPGDDEAQSAQFDRLMERMKADGLVHYEISNFGREGHFSRHNTSYWRGIPYLGIGPSAHSFNGSVRRWNVSNNLRYAASIEGGTSFSEMETLTPSQRTNELLLTGLRTQWGVDLAALPIDVCVRNERTIVSYQDRGMVERAGTRLVLTERGRHFADRIAMDLFVTE